MSYNVPYSFTPGTKAKAQEVNANFISVAEQIDNKLNKNCSNITQTGLDVIKNSLSTRNIGEIIFSTIPLTDNGLHLLDGSLLNSGGIYSEFVELIAQLYADEDNENIFTDETSWQSSVTTYGVCGKFVYNSTNNTVRLPKITGIVEGTTDLTALGDLVQAGLPVLNTNTTGVHAHSFGGSNDNPTEPRNGLDLQSNGLFYRDVVLATSLAGDHSHTTYWNGHTSTNTVQPQTTKVLCYIVVATSVKTEIQIDIDEIATDLNGKADTDGTNITTGFSTQIANNMSDSANIYFGGLSMPSDESVALTIGSSGATYTAPADGWFKFDSNTYNSTGWVYLRNQTANGLCFYAESANGIVSSGYIPVSEGDTVEFGYAGGASPIYLRFVYAVGSESEAN